MSEVEMRLYEPHDAAAIAQLLSKAGQPITAEQFDRDLDEPGERIRENTFVVCVQGEVVAYASLCFVEQVEQFDVYCYAAVDVDRRRRGIGTRLFAYVVERVKMCAREEAKPLVFIHRADTRIEGLQQFGEQHGMEKTRENVLMCLEGESAVAQVPRVPLPNGYVFGAPTLQDAAAWAEIDNAAFERPGAKKAEQVAFEFAGDLFTPEFYILCETVDGTAVGFIEANVQGDHARIPTLAVHPDVQGKGIGKALLTGLISRLQQAGVQSVGLSVDLVNHRAYALYRQLGFVEEGRVVFYSLRCG